MRYALNSLCNVAYLLVDSKDCKKSLLAATEELSQSQSRLQGATEMESNIFNNGVMPNDEIKLPTLEGRATVILEFYRPRTEAGINDTTGTDGIIGKRARRTSNGVILDNIGRPVDPGDDGTRVYAKLIVDGINHPLAGGNFLDLCLKGHYDNTGIHCDTFMFSSSRGELESGDSSETMGISRKVMGNKDGNHLDDGYIDAKKKIKRRFPLEVFRQKEKEEKAASPDSGSYTNVKVRYTAVGSARNSAVFTQNAPPVMSFATYGAIGMWHAQNDDAGASSSFFSIPFDNTQSVTARSKKNSMARLNQKYSLFAYCVDGNDVLINLKEGDVLTRAVVEPGLYNLSR